MISDIKIENFAIIDAAELHFHPHFNVLTGESGAGKSILVDALNFVLGERISGAKISVDNTARVQARFEIGDKCPRVMEELRSAGIIEQDSDELILSRKMYPSGRNIYHINGQMVPWKLYLPVGQSLVDIHGQRDNLYLLKPDNQRVVLDMPGGENVKELLRSLANLHGHYRELTSKISSLKDMERERNREIEWISYQTSEIESAQLDPNEENDLEKRKTILENAGRISESAAEIYENLSGDNGVIDKLNSASGELMQWAGYDPDMEEQSGNLETILAQVQEISFMCREKGEEIDFSQDTLDNINHRLHQIEGLKRKYGVTIDDILKYLQNSREKLAELEKSNETICTLENELEDARREWLEKSGQLSVLRKEIARTLEKTMSDELSSLGMESASFRVNVSSNKGIANDEDGNFTITPYGFDNVEFLFEPNPGIPEKPLRLIASGGELSRVMLAFKNVLSRFFGYSSLVLDEIDMGLGGVSAQVVARKLREISKNRQILCITHLPVIAAMADTHYNIEKITGEEKTRAVVSLISGKERVREVMRMISGEEPPGETRKLAEKMLKK
ncbi:MAG: DNA repair protein RecN [Candidatus Eremiobacteraeota bacterium]|nr:DNA repair protein RecN [Candidatus Eremiobacteraeota bacterium]